MRWESWRVASRNEARWREAGERGLLKAESLGGYVLRLWFEEVLDVAIYDLDFGPLLIEEDPGPAFYRKWRVREPDKTPSFRSGIQNGSRAAEGGRVDQP